MSTLVRAASLTHYDEVARSVGLDPRRMLAEVGLSAGMLREPDLLVPAELVRQLLENSAAASGVESFGLRMAETRQLSNLGLVGMLIRDQRTLRDSIEVLVRYQAFLNASLSVMIEEAGGVVVIREEVIVGPRSRSVRQSTELAVGVMLRLMRQVLGPQWQPRRVCFAHGAPRDIATHLRVFGPRVEFDHGFNGIVCSAAELDAVNASADPAMAHYAQELLDAALKKGQSPVLDDVRRTALLLLPVGRCSIDQVASHLGLACRTVQRRLADQGISFSALVNDIRLELAQRHVVESARPLNEVAGLLGFSAPSGFSRWYHTQFGCSPSQGRAAHRARH